MSGLFGLLHATSLTLQAQEAALATINHNVANANTPGYSRQRISFETRNNIGNSIWAIGGGVAVSGIERISNSFLLGQMGRARAGYGEQATMTRSYSVIENTFGEPADSMMGETTLGDTISDFLSSWQPALNPEMESSDGDMRGLIVEAARVLAVRFNNVASGLQGQMDSLHEDLDIAVSESNRLMNEIGELNQQLSGSAATGSTRAGLLDQRDQSLQRLSQLIGVDWIVNDREELKIYVGGRCLVDHTTVHEIEVVKTGSPAERNQGARIFLKDDPYDMTVRSGELKGILNMINEDLPEVMDRLDALASTLMERVNELHQQASGDGGGGCAIFVGEDARSMAVNQVVLDNPDAISMMGTLDDGRDMASAIFELHDEEIAGIGGQTLAGYYATTVGDFGAKSRSALQLAGASERILTGLDQQLQSESGVNIDEELANMLVVQTTYQAAAKIISVVNEMMQTLVTIV